MNDDFSFDTQFAGSSGPDAPFEPTEDSEPKAQSSDMSRGQQTVWIVGTIAVVGMAILYNVTRLPDNHPWKECERIIGMNDACVARIAGRELMKGY